MCKLLFAEKCIPTTKKKKTPGEYFYNVFRGEKL